MLVTRGKLKDVTMTHKSYTREAVELELTCSVFTVVICRQPLDCGAIKLPNSPALFIFCTLK
jgi:hypothetical protein